MMSEEEKARRIAQGEALRQERARKKHEEFVRYQKEAILQESLVERDDFHQGLKNRIEESEMYLQKILHGRAKLEMKEVSKILDLFSFPSELDARVGYKICRYEYDRLICLCWQFSSSRSIVLRQKAYVFWNEMMLYPEVQATGSVIIALLCLGLLCKETGNILRDHCVKFKQAGLSCVINATCKRLLKQGGVVDVQYGNIREFSWKQCEILKGIIDLYEEKDFRSLEQIAEFSD